MASLELDTTEKALREHGENVVMMINQSNRHHTIANNHPSENMKLGKGSEARKASKRKAEIQKCHSLKCFITKFDKCGVGTM